MDFHLSEDQLMIQENVRKFAQREVKPVAAEYDRRVDPKDRYPWELWKQIHAMGLLALPISPKWGGGGSSMLTQVIVCEELGAGDGSLGCAVATHLQKAHLLDSLLNKEQQEEFIPQFMNDDTYIIGNAMTEPEQSSDLVLPYDKPGASMKTFAYRDGNEYVINGVKRFITQAAVAKLFIIWARTDKNKPISQAMSAFLVPSGTPGLSIGNIDDPMGGRLEARAEVIMENLRVPAHYLIGEENGMYSPRMSEYIPDLLCVVASAVGEARTCYEETKEFAKTRIQGGKPIIEHINIGTRLVDMHVGIEASRTLLHKTAWAWDTKYKYDPMMPYLAKAFIMDIISKLYLDTLEIWAGMGVQKGVSIERHFRNHFAILHGGGTPVFNRIQAMNMLAKA